jgi:hypothetical protein
MSAFMQCFTIDELEPLDERQLSHLRHAIEREVRNNPEIHRILRDKFGPIRDRMAAQGGAAPAGAAPRRPRGSGPRRRT